MLDTGRLVMEGTLLRDNQAASGGAILTQFSSARITNAQFEGNTAAEGGAIFSYGAGEPLEVQSSRFTANRAGSGYAIWIQAGRVVNSLFVDNVTDDGHGGVILARPREGNSVMLLHNTIVKRGDPDSLAVVAQSGVTIRNSIIAGYRESIGLYAPDAGEPVADHNLFWNSPQIGGGLSADPQFVDPANCARPTPECERTRRDGQRQ